MFWANSYSANADCASCTQDCNNLNSTAPEVPIDCNAYCLSQCSSTATPLTGTPTATSVGTVVDGNACYDNTDCKSGYCNTTMTSSEFGTGVCASNPSAAAGGAQGGGALPISGTGAPGGGTGVQPSGTGIVIPTDTGLPAPPGGIAQIVKNLLTWLLGIVGVIAIIGFVISGIQYLTSTGDEDRMQSAKRNMLYAIIGVVVVLSSFVVIQAIQYALEARSMF